MSADRRLQSLEDAMWGTVRDPEGGLVTTVRRIENRQEQGRKGQVVIMAGVVVAILTPAATILLTRAAG